jgi:hypothetical protein
MFANIDHVPHAQVPVLTVDAPVADPRPPPVTNDSRKGPEFLLALRATRGIASEMIRLSITQILNIWTELDDAFYGVNRFGGDSAEICGYLLMRFDPRILHPGSLARQARTSLAQQAGDSLAQLLAQFISVRNCQIEIDGRPFDGTMPPLDHRCHVRVIRQ